MKGAYQVEKVHVYRHLLPNCKWKFAEGVFSFLTSCINDWVSEIRHMCLVCGHDARHTLIDVMMATTGLSLVISNTSWVALRLHICRQRNTMVFKPSHFELTLSGTHAAGWLEVGKTAVYSLSREGEVVGLGLAEGS